MFWAKNIEQNALLRFSMGFLETFPGVGFFHILPTSEPIASPFRPQTMVFTFVVCTMHVWVSVVCYIRSKSTFLRKIEKFRKFPIFSRITRFASPSGPGAIHASKPSKITKITDLVSSQMGLSVRYIFFCFLFSFIPNFLNYGSACD